MIAMIACENILKFKARRWQKKLYNSFNTLETRIKHSKNKFTFNKNLRVAFNLIN